MALEKATIPLPIAGGVDTRSDKRHVRPPKCLALENVRFTGNGTMRKRFGGTTMGNSYSSVSGTTRSTSSFSQGHHLFASSEKLYTMEHNKLLAWDEATDTWQLHGLMPLVEVDVSPVVTPVANAASHTDVARTTDGLQCAVGEIPGLYIWVSILDEVTGSRYLFTLNGANVSNIKVTTIGTTLMVFWANNGAPHSLFLKTFTRSALPTLATNCLSSPTATVVSAGLRDYASGAGGNSRYDVAAYDGTKCLLAYAASAGLTIECSFIDTSGAIGTSASQAVTAFPDDLTLAVADSGGNWALIWATNTSNNLVGRIRNSSMTAVTAATTIEAMTGVCYNLGATWANSTTVQAVWQIPNSVSKRQVRHGSLNTSAAVTAGLLFHNAGLVSKPWTVATDDTYCLMGTYDLNNALTLVVVVRLGTPAGAAVSFPGSTQVGTVVANVIPDSIPLGSYDSNRLPHVVLGAASGPGFAVPYENYLVPILVFTVPDMEIWNVRIVGLHFVDDNADAYDFQPTPIRMGAALHVPSGVTWRVDPEAVYETGFIQPFAATITLTPSNAAGALTSGGTYLYRVYQEWTSANGEREQSTAVEQSVTLGGADDTVTITINTIPFTNRSARLGLRNFGFGIYRANPGSAIFRRISDGAVFEDATANGYILNDQTVASVTFTDELSDSSSVGEIDYLTDGEVENIAPSACKLAVVSNGRAFLSGFSHDGDLIWFGKIRESETALAFSSANTIFVEAGDGPITALGSLGDALIVFRRRQIYVIGGEGPNDVGTGGAFLDARLIKEGVGCSNPASVGMSPVGLFFQAGDGMVYLLGTDMSVSPIGADVYALTRDATITSAVAVEEEREVRFTFWPATGESGTDVLVWHQDIGWSTRTYPGAFGACSWQGTWVAIANEGGDIYREVRDQNYGNASDLSFVMAYESAWLRTSQLVQGADRFVRLLASGEWRGNHKVRVRIAYDYDDTWVDDLDWIPTVTSSTGNYEFEVRPSRQRIQAYKVRIEDVDDGINPLRDSFTLSELALELGSYGTPAHLAASRRAT